MRNRTKLKDLTIADTIDILLATILAFMVFAVAVLVLCGAVWIIACTIRSLR